MNILDPLRRDERGSADMILAGVFFVLVFAAIGYHLLTNSDAATQAAAAPACGPAGAWTSSAKNGGHDEDGYYFGNNEWGAVSGSAQTIWVASPTSWGICSQQPNPPAGVKTYAEEQKTVGTPIKDFTGMTNTVSYSLPSKGTWEAADDLWVNGTPGQAGAIEVMIWTDTHYQRPAGTEVGAETIGSQKYDFWKTSGSTHIYTLVYQTNETSTTVHMLSAFNWLASKGYISTADTFSQFNFGYEIVGTGGQKENFKTTNFSLSLTQ